MPRNRRDRGTSSLPLALSSVSMVLSLLLALTSIFVIALPAVADCCDQKKTFSATEIERLIESDEIEPGCDPERFAQAKILLKSCSDYIEKAKALHERMEANILIAKTLKGETNLNVNSMPVKSLNLQGPALQAAIRQYAADLQAFADHAQMYKANVERFRRDIGECKASQAEYDRQRELYTLHANEFHVNNLASIEPPHICGALDFSENEANALSTQLRSDEQRLTATVGNLGQQNALVAEGRNLAQTNLANTVRASIRDQEEQKLSGQFGRLKEEYELLQIQRKVLSPTAQKQAGSMVRVKSVTGVVKPSSR